MSDVLVSERTTSPAVYAISAAFLSAFPIPFVNGTLSSLARGSAVRRVCRRRGVELTADASLLLAEPGFRRNPSTWTGKLARVALGRTFSSINIASRLEAGLSTYFATILLDRYLASDLRKEGSALERAEAERVREAMERAFESVSLEALQTLPSFGYRTARMATKQAQRNGGIRERVEIWVDTLLDELATTPSEVTERLSDAFFEAVRREHVAV